MAKISPVSIKYMIHARFEAIGPVEKPDVIGALFGQTEGLLGADLEIRELQKEGKIGRIEVDVKSSDGRSTGKIEIPTAIDKSETSLIAAAIETIDRIGPTEAKIEVESIEDVRGNKRDYILERAKKLLESMDQDTNSKEISNTLRTSARSSKIQEYGEEKLSAGELEENEIIVVEGKADVINLLENRITNVIGMNGTKLPKEIAELGKKKELTLFLDGDRGGKLIAKNVMENASVAYVAFAPDGKEVEELNGKEILASLRRKIPAKEFSSSRDFFDKSYGSLDESKSEDSKKEIDKNKLAKILKELSGTKSTYFFDDNLELIRKTSNSNAGREIKELQRVAVIIIDGKAMPSLIQSAEQINVKFIAAKNFSEAPRGSIEFISF